MINRASIKKIIKIFLVICAVAVITSYSYYRFKDYIGGPKIIVYEPENGSVVSTSTTMIRGRVMRINDISINNRPISIDNDGNFNEILLLHKGYNVSLIHAVDKFDRTIEYKLELVYKDQ